MKKILLLGIAILIASGCASTTIKPGAFGHKKRYAVVSIIGSPDITDIDGGGGPGYHSTSLVGLISAAASKDINTYENSDKMFTYTQHILDKVFSKAKSFEYIPSNVVLKSSAYKHARGSKPKYGIFSIGLAPGYKYFDSDNMGEVKKIMRRLHLDGAIIINAQYNYGTGGFNLFGLISFGSTHGMTTLTVSAVDKSLNTVWTQHIKKDSDESIPNVGGVPRFSKLYPVLKDTTRDALQEAVNTLDTTVYAKN